MQNVRTFPSSSTVTWLWSHVTSGTRSWITCRDRLPTAGMPSSPTSNFRWITNMGIAFTLLPAQGTAQRCGWARELRRSQDDPGRPPVAPQDPQRQAPHGVGARVHQAQIQSFHDHYAVSQQGVMDGVPGGPPLL